ncbi:MAG: TetR/AcrR family transcriptional regulator [Deltaproteobacteria bacterium]|nr:TetR/AcrR family transcriptional regulator [Deltaproteobacteria bacterium]
MPGSRFYNLSEEKQARILQAAKVEFIEKGPVKASLNRIIKNSGISKGAMYYYFNDKNDLLATVLDTFIKSFLDSMEFNLDSSSIETYWSSFTSTFFEIFKTTEFQEIMTLSKGLSPEFLEDILKDSKYPQINHIWIGTMIKSGIEAGAVRKELPEKLSIDITIHLFSMLDTWLIPYFDNINEEIMPVLISAYIEILRGILEPDYSINGEKLLIFKEITHLK